MDVVNRAVKSHNLGMCSKIFTNSLDLELIELVKMHPILYFKHKNYCNSDETKRIWTKIARLLNKTVPECKTRWRTIRDSYKKNKKRDRMASTAGPRMTKSKYDNYDLKFLDELNSEMDYRKEDVKVNFGLEISDTSIEPEVNHITTTGRTNYLTVKEEVLDLEDPNEEATASQGQTHQELDEHPIDIFFRSMAAVVVNFPPHLVAETRMKVCQVVSEMELRLLKDQS